jgi:hypothetical protein
MISLITARSLFSNTVDAARRGKLDWGDMRQARTRLTDMRDHLRGRERRQIDLYLTMLSDEWAAAASSNRLLAAKPLGQEMISTLT